MPIITGTTICSPCHWEMLLTITFTISREIIIGLIDSEGTLVVSYQYDTWGSSVQDGKNIDSIFIRE